MQNRLTGSEKDYDERETVKIYVHGVDVDIEKVLIVSGINLKNLKVRHTFTITLIVGTFCMLVMHQRENIIATK